MVGGGGGNVSGGGGVDELLLQLVDSNDRDVLLLLDQVTLNDTVGNSSLSVNDTLLLITNESPYPSGHSMTHIIAASVVVTVMMIVVVVGNMLVIIAIATEKSLKNIQNWFIASLAVSDFFLGLVIMPFSLANELMGYWMFGPLWCDIHSALDVLLSTASIMNLCLISLDRYWSITQAIDYLKRRTPVRAAIMICLVWILSALICIPPLLGWKVEREPEEFPKCEVCHFFDHASIVRATCNFSKVAPCMQFILLSRLVRKRHSLKLKKSNNRSSSKRVGIILSRFVYDTVIRES